MSNTLYQTQNILQLEKQCTMCNRVLAISEFYKKSDGKYGVTSVCKKCSTVQVGQYRRKNSIKINEHRRQYQKNNPEKVLAWRNRQQLNIKLLSYKHNAKKRNLVWELSDEQAIELFYYNCFYCGMEPNPLNGIDRYDNNEGYIIANSKSCCTLCNKAKNNMHGNEFLMHIYKIVKYQQSAKIKIEI